MSAPTTPDLTKELTEIVGKAATVETVQGSKNVAKATAQETNPTPNIVPALLIAVRFGLHATPEERERVSAQVEKIAKRPGMPPIIVCPVGVSVLPVFEPAEMANWRNEIKELRVRCAQLSEQLEATKTQFNSVQRAAKTMQGELAALNGGAAAGVTIPVEA